MIHINSVRKTYGEGANEKIALFNINLTINDGEFVMILGASGSGKTSLIQLLAGIDSPTGGSVHVDGVDVFSQSDDELALYRRKKVNLIYQNYNLIPMLTVKENIILPSALDREKINEDRLKDVTSFLKIEELLERFPDELSGGQQQKTGIARCLYTNSNIILADEPTGNLDTQSGVSVMELLKKLNTNYNKTIIVITHNTDLTVYANRIITLSDGAIIADEVRK